MINAINGQDFPRLQTYGPDRVTPGGTAFTAGGRTGMSWTVTFDLTPSDQALVSAATGGTFGNSPQGTSTLVEAGNSDFTSAREFADAIASLRRSAGPNKPITPSMLIAAAKHASVNGTPFPEGYLANAIGYLNGIG